MSRIHPIDRLAPLGFLLDRRTRVFPGGWGAESVLAIWDDPVTAADPIPPLELEWGRKEEHPGYRTRRARVESPLASALPADARVMTVEWLEPAVGADRTVVLLPAWNDEGFDVRRRLAIRLAARRIGSYIADIPFYGQRRVHPTGRPAIDTVADFVLMGQTAVAEGRALVAHAALTAEAGVSGYSMGGNLAAFVSATVVRPIATAPLAASHGPAPVYLDAALRKAIRWDALGGRDHAEPRLRAILEKGSVLHLPPLPHHRTAIVVSGSRDGLVPTHLSRQLAGHWEAELRVVEGVGHGTLLWRHPDLLVSAIVDSFERVAQ